MKGLNYWEQFMATGKIEDFLAYKDAARQEERGNVAVEEGELKVTTKSQTPGKQEAPRSQWQ